MKTLVVRPRATRRRGVDEPGTTRIEYRRGPRYRAWDVVSRMFDRIRLNAGMAARVMSGRCSSELRTRGLSG
jgi:hypothetical protein